MIAANVLTDWRHAARARALWANWHSILWVRTLQFWGTYRGYRDAHTPLTAPLRQTFYYPRGLEPGESAVRGVEPIRYNDPND
jgi:hypothetical protein